MEIRSVGLCLKPDQPQTAAAVLEVVHWLKERGLEVLGDEGCPEDAALERVPREEVASRVDLVVVMGGDGTLLSVARATGTRSVPILGVNLGRLGFLTEINIEELIPALDKMLAGDLNVEPRMRLEVVVQHGERDVACYQALNDAVVTKTALSRMIDLEAFADGLLVTNYHADGLIVATPTGSTAYSLSAGGPIVMPGLAAISLTPICPHSLTQRPLVLPSSSEIELAVASSAEDVVLTVDGQAGMPLSGGDRVRVRRSPHPVAIVASPFRNRYEILHAKLHWGKR